MLPEFKTIKLNIYDMLKVVLSVFNYKVATQISKKNYLDFLRF